MAPQCVGCDVEALRDIRVRKPFVDKQRHPNLLKREPLFHKTQEHTFFALLRLRFRSRMLRSGLLRRNLFLRSAAEIEAREARRIIPEKERREKKQPYAQKTGSATRIS